MGYVWLLTEKRSLAVSFQKGVYIASTYMGMLAICIFGVIFFSKTENKIKNKIKEKQNKLSKQIKEKTDEITLNKERIKELNTEIENILRKIDIIGNTDEIDRYKEKIKNNYEEEDMVIDCHRRLYTRKRTL